MGGREQYPLRNCAMDRQWIVDAWPMKLTDLLLKDTGTPSPRELQGRAQKRFWEIVGEGGLKRWRKGDERPLSGRWVLIGLAPAYSVRDLELAETIIETIKGKKASAEFQLFDLLDVADIADMQNFIPIEKVFHSPVVGVWQDGALVAAADGFAGRQLVLGELSSMSE
jgi:hypothetical protein